jgi:hypothetical protein
MAHVPETCPTVSWGSGTRTSWDNFASSSCSCLMVHVHRTLVSRTPPTFKEPASARKIWHLWSADTHAWTAPFSVAILKFRAARGDDYSTWWRRWRRTSLDCVLAFCNDGISSNEALYTRASHAFFQAPVCALGYAARHKYSVLNLSQDTRRQTEIRRCWNFFFFLLRKHIARCICF